MKGQSLTHFKCIGICFFIKVPALGKARHHIILSIVGCQTCKNQRIYFTMLIKSRINSCIIAAAVYERIASVYI